MFDRGLDAGIHVPLVATGPVFVSGGVGEEPRIEETRRRRLTTLTEDDGKIRPMSNLDLTMSFLSGAAKTLPANKAVDMDRLKQRGKLITEGQKLFEDLAQAAGVNLGTRACLDPVLSVAEMSKAVGKLLAAVKAEKYRDRRDMKRPSG